LQDYEKKILNPAEYAFCGTFEHLNIIWAIKESAYKCHYKKGGAGFINPKRIMISELNFLLQTFSVIVNDQYLKGYYRVSEKFIYAVCFDEHSSSCDTQVNIHMGGSTKKSVIDRITRLPLHRDIHLINHPEGFPVGLLHGEKQYDYSRSHHGDYYISAITPCPYN